MRKRLVRAIHAEGGKILAGSDSPNPMVVHGFALHRELGYLRQTGLSNYDVLETATANPAEFLRGRRKAGTIAVGAPGDVLLLDGNPLEDLSHLARPLGVMMRGSWYPRDRLDAMLDQVSSRRAESVTRRRR